MGTAPATAPASTTVSNCSFGEPMEAAIRKFWELEEVDVPPILSPDDKECEDIYRRTTSRDVDGRYTVALPFKGDPSTLGDSRRLAEKCFFCLERKMLASPKLKQAYDDIIREYLEKGYLSPAPPEMEEPSYIIPHHGVIREDKLTSKLRIVLNASAKTSTSVSLNDLLYNGQNLQGNLFNIIINFRLFPIALSADIRQMFLCIGIRECDCRFQRILYRFSPDEPLKVYQFNRVCFGLKSSPFHALRTTRQLASDEAETFPKANETLQTGIYMDDYVYSVEDEAKAISIAAEVIALMKAGQFDLVKWTSNSQTVLDSIPTSHRLSSVKEFDESDSHKVNGSWGLPAFVCDVYIAMDVTSSTSSIFNLVAISVDRYIAVTQPIKYAKHKNNRRVWFTIVLVWLISAAIGAPIVLGLNDTPDRNFDECLFNSQNYVIYSSLGSFYIPCIMMMFLYYNIFKALRNRAKKQRAAKKPPVSGDPTTGATAAVVIENVAQTRRLQETALHDDRPTNTGSGSNEDDHEDSFDKRSADLEADADDCHVIPNDKSTEFMLATVAEETANSTPKRKLKSQPPDPNGNNDSGYAPSNLEDTIREHMSPPGSPGLKDATVLKNMGCDSSKWKKNGKTAKLVPDSRNVSLQVRSEDEQEITASQYDLSDGSTAKKERKASAATARFTIYKANKASKKKREKSSAKKERKATKTLAIVLGVFLFCWAPFFTCSVLGAICDKFNLPFSPGVTTFILTTWLGYINSFLNPVIYTIFNPEFRKAFRKILKCGT